MKRIPVLYLLNIICILFFSCKDDHEYQVDAALDSYLQMFLDEGAKRGFYFDVEENGLYMEFADLEPPTVGCCSYTDPLLVRIDRTYWNEVKQFDNCEDLRQVVVFHELAHGLLNRGHEYGTLDNTEWKSLMYGGDSEERNVAQVNFSGIRKQYYWDELFNIKTPQPSWGRYGDVFSGKKGDTICAFDFSKSKRRVDGEGNSYEVDNGVFTITLNQENSSFVNLLKCRNLDKDFYYEVELKSEFGDTRHVGIALGYLDSDSSIVHNYFGVMQYVEYGQNRAYVAHQRCYTPFTEVVLRDEVCDLQDFTRLAVERRGSWLYYYVNDQQVYCNDYMAERSYNTFSIVATGRNSVVVSSAVCYDQSDINFTK